MTLPIRNSRIQLPQGQLFWREVGVGPTIVFLHGAWSDSSQWVPLMEHLGDRFHCLAPDLLGFAESGQPTAHLSITLQAECLASYLDLLRIRQPVYIVGHSVGAWVAAQFALQDLNRVQGLVLIDPEGVTVEGQYPWRRSRGWVGRMPWKAWLLWLWRPLAMATGQQERWRSLRQFQRRLQRSPAACTLLFQRRWEELNAELLSDRLPWLKCPLLSLQTANADPSNAASQYATAPEAQYKQLSSLESSDLEQGSEAIAELTDLLTNWLTPTRPAPMNENGTV